MDVLHPGLFGNIIIAGVLVDVPWALPFLGFQVINLQCEMKKDFLIGH